MSEFKFGKGDTVRLVMSKLEIRGIEGDLYVGVETYDDGTVIRPAGVPMAFVDEYGEKAVAS